MDSKHLLHQLMVGPTTAHEERLQPRCPLVRKARKMLNELSKLSIRAAQWINYHTWGAKFFESQSEPCFFQGPWLEHLAYVRLNQLNRFALELEDSSHQL